MQVFFGGASPWRRASISEAKASHFAFLKLTILLLGWFDDGGRVQLWSMVRMGRWSLIFQLVVVKSAVVARPVPTAVRSAEE